MKNQFNFTKAKLNALPEASGTNYDTYHDTAVKGLKLIVTNNDVKTFYVYKKVNGKPERIKIGRFPDLTIEQARNQAQVILARIAQGENPADKIRRIRTIMNIEELFQLFEQKHGRYKKSWSNDKNLYENYLSPWAMKRISDIRKSDVKDLHNEIGKANDHPYQANRVRALLHTLYEFAIERGYDGINPCRGVKKHPEHKRDRFVQKDEMPRLFSAIDNDPHPIISDFIQIALFTGARSGNIQSMRWEEIDWSRETWTIPETKSGQSYTVPLVRNAIEVLRERQKTVDGTWVFPSTLIESHIREPKVQWNRICEAANLDNLRIHDLRRTLASWMAMTGASMLLISSALGHKLDTSSVTAVYARLDIEPVRKAIENAVDAMLRAGRTHEDDVNISSFIKAQ